MLHRVRDWLGDQRNRLLARPGFRDWASRFPLTQPVARQQAGRLFDLVSGFVYSQVLFSFVQLDIVSALRNGPRTAADLATHCRLTPDRMGRLLDAANALDLLHQCEDGRFQLGALGAALQDNTPVAAMVLHHASLYQDLSDPVALLRGENSDTALARYWAYAASNAPAATAAESVRDYTQLMAASQPLVAEDILTAVSLRHHRCLLDVGGGDGTFLLAAANRAPHLQLKLFDLPAVTEVAKQRFASAQLGARVECIGGSFHEDAIPSGADVISLVRVLHDHDDEPALALLKRIRAALPSNGTLVLAEPMTGVPGAARFGDVYFGFYFLAMKSGRLRSVQQNKDLLMQAGFSHASHRKTGMPLHTQIVLAEA